MSRDNHDSDHSQNTGNNSSKFSDADIQKISKTCFLDTICLTQKNYWAYFRREGGQKSTKFHFP